MKVAVSAGAGNIDAMVDERFGRAPWFVLVDMESGTWSAHENRASGSGHGAGIEAATSVARLDADAVLTGSVGPNAERTLRAAGVRVHAIESGTVREAVEALRAGRLQELTGPSAAGHHGLRPAMDRGVGRAGGGNRR